MNKIQDWMKQNASQDVVSLDFLLSDLKEIKLSQQERIEQAFNDRYAVAAADRGQGQGNVPPGKQVR